MSAQAAAFASQPQKLTRVQIPQKLLVLAKPKRFKIIHGGRGSAKSHTVARLLIAKADLSTVNILCVRETMSSIKKSSYKLLVNTIKTLGLQHRFRCTATQIIHCGNGSVFDFIGLREQDAEGVKSYEGYDIAWVEEAQSVKKRGFKMLIDTIRKVGSEIWCTFNPTRATDYVYDRFVANHDADAMVIQMNWRDNPWFSPANELERRKDKAANDAEYQHIWEGKLRSQGGIIFKREWAKYYLPKEKPELRIYGASDYATAKDEDLDFTEHGCAGLDDDGNLYFTDWWSGQENADIWIGAFIALVKRNAPLIWFEEKGVILRALDATITKTLRKRKAVVFRKPIASAGNKADRALGFAALMSMGMVYFPLNKDGSKPAWVERLVNQLCEFTGKDGEVDDMVDVCSLLARGLRLMSNAPKEPPKPEDREVAGVGSKRMREGMTREEQEDEDLRMRRAIRHRTPYRRTG